MDLPMTTLSFRLPVEDKMKFINLANKDVGETLRDMVHSIVRFGKLTTEQEQELSRLRQERECKPATNETQLSLFDYAKESKNETV